MRLAGVIGVGMLAFAVSQQAGAWSQETHRRIVLDAVQYMKNNPATTRYAKLAAWAQSGGVTVDQLAQTIGQSAYDVDDFQDTYICGAITGDCQRAPLWSLAASLAHYTSFWHFQNHTRGADVHGNDFGGYDYSRMAHRGDVDELAAGWLWNDHLDDGSGGMRGFFSDGSKYNTYGITERNYRIGSTSTAQMYADYQNFPFQPIDNLAQYWWSQFLSRPTPQTVGYVLHATDLVQPHHTWMTSGNNHSAWEGWVNDYYYSEGFNNPALVTAALQDGTFTQCGSTAATDIRPLLTQGGAYSYRIGGVVLSSTAHDDRSRIARQAIPHAIAMTVSVLNCAAERVARVP
ncbi:hypothetical protein [Tahibacter amnicola]|uniref:Phospholipase n=1 Tax=Tahibacter amnicola TaxID=2976241 RepID=A0ABY6BIT2_9GAMM|nr:hypothetical protein [Tahibacter amnicola]UXI69779.1 hypothetical protein N4264_09160 [Tahibacter amnicola]